MILRCRVTKNILNKRPWKALPFLILIHNMIRIYLISTDILQKCSKLSFFSMESFELHFVLVLNGKRINQKAKPNKRSLVVGDQTGIQVLGLCCFVSEEFDHNDLTSIALYFGKTRELPSNAWINLKCSPVSQPRPQLSTRVPLGGLDHFHGSYIWTTTKSLAYKLVDRLMGEATLESKIELRLVQTQTLIVVLFCCPNNCTAKLQICFAVLYGLKHYSTIGTLE